MQGAFLTDSLVDSADCTVSVRAFTDSAVFALEQQTVFTNSWLCLGHTSQFKCAGDFVQTWAGNKPLLLCLSDDGQYHAFANVCSHALVQTVIQSYSPPEFRGRAIALFHMSQVVMTVGSMGIGSLAAIVGTQWAVALMGAAGVLAMLGMHIALPRAWRIR